MFPTKEYLWDCFEYNDKSGELRWKHTRPRSHFPTERGWKIFNKCYGGKAIDTKDTHGYIVVGLSVLGIGYMRHRIHRLICYMHYGEVPEIVDHKNMDRADNRINNLRASSKVTNGQNRGKQRNNTSGFKGVTRSTCEGRWIAQIWKNRKRIHLGSFGTAADAHAAYCRAAENLHGKFARTE